MTDWDELADRLGTAAVADGAPTRWFEELWSAADRGEVSTPWDRSAPHRALAEWTEGMSGAGRRAVVVGAGLGADAEHLAALGFATTAFDISATAVRTARDRNPDSAVDYRVADLLDLPAELVGTFDMVVEVFTTQALPQSLRSRPPHTTDSMRVTECGIGPLGADECHIRSQRVRWIAGFEGQGWKR